MVSAGLTNNPNLDLVALNQSEGDLPETPMDKILEALGLNSSASEGDAVEAITKLKNDEATARNRAETPDPAKFVPKADYELARNRVQELEQGEEARLETEITDAVGAAVQAGKIAPASRDYHIAACRAAGGVEEFQKMVGATPEIGGDVDLPDDPGKATGASNLSADELAVCSALDMSPEDFAAQKAADAQE
jgi:phage I-like protein